MKILESDDSKADDEQREGQEGHDRERSFEVKDDHQTRLKEQFTNHSKAALQLSLVIISFTYFTEAQPTLCPRISIYADIADLYKKNFGSITSEHHSHFNLFLFLPKDKITSHCFELISEGKTGKETQRTRINRSGKSKYTYR